MPQNSQQKISRSMAIWYKRTEADNNGPAEQIRQNPDNNPVASLHFNLWKFNKGWRFDTRSFLDIGILLKNYEHVSEVSVFIPGEISGWGSDVNSIADKFSDGKTAVAVFNEDLTTLNTNRYVDLKDGNNVFTRAWRLEQSEVDVCDQLVLNEVKAGIILKINTTAMERIKGVVDAAPSVYFRIRVDYKNVVGNTFISVISPFDNNFMSGFDTIECIDFKINEKRNLPEEVNRKISDNSEIFIDRIDFLLATDVTADFISGHKPFHKCRMLEKEIWNQYIGEEFPDKIVIYHWKAESKENKVNNQTIKYSIKEFNSFLKFRVRRSSYITILKYMAWTAFIGAVGSYIASHVPLLKQVACAISN